MTTQLKCMLGEANRGIASSAYKAGKMLEDEGYSDVIAQVQYRRAARSGYAPAQRLLGILGLCGKLIEEGSSICNVRFCDSPEAGITWIREAACGGDALSVYILGKCHQLGLGVEKDEDKAALILNSVVAYVSWSEVISFSMLLESVTRQETDAHAAFKPSKELLHLVRNRGTAPA